VIRDQRSDVGLVVDDQNVMAHPLANITAAEAEGTDCALRYAG
jgi:hypothetical protein